MKKFLPALSVAIFVATSTIPALAASVTVRPVSAQTRSEAKTTKKTEMKTAKVTVDGACVATLIGTREEAVMAAFATASSSWTTARTALASALATAWTNKDAAARKTAWATYDKTLKSVNTTRKTAVRAAWSTFSAGVKTTCHGTAADAASEAAGTALDLQ